MTSCLIKSKALTFEALSSNQDVLQRVGHDRVIRTTGPSVPAGRAGAAEIVDVLLSHAGLHVPGLGGI